MITATLKENQNLTIWFNTETHNYTLKVINTHSGFDKPVVTDETGKEKNFTWSDFKYFVVEHYEQLCQYNLINTIEIIFKYRNKLCPQEQNA